MKRRTRRPSARRSSAVWVRWEHNARAPHRVAFTDSSQQGHALETKGEHTPTILANALSAEEPTGRGGTRARTAGLPLPQGVLATRSLLHSIGSDLDAEIGPSSTLIAPPRVDTLVRQKKTPSGGRP